MDTELQNDVRLSHHIEYINTMTSQTEKTYDGQQLSFGILVRDNQVYDYFAGGL